MLDVDWGDLIYYLGDDPHTQSIVIYMETIGNARAFLSAAREVALTKPIIVIKPGRTEGAAKAAASHTGSLTGSDEVLEVAFRRSGVLRVNSIAELFYMAEVLGKQPRPKGPRLTILTNAGGPGVLATDCADHQRRRAGQSLQRDDGRLQRAAARRLEPQQPGGHPRRCQPGALAKALEIAAKDPNSDGMLVILTPQAMTDPTKTAEALAPYATSLGKPVIATWMGGNDVAAGEADPQPHEHPDLPLSRYGGARLRLHGALLREPAQPVRDPHACRQRRQGELDRERAASIIEAARASGRTILTEYESKQLLACYGIPTVETRIAKTADEAVTGRRRDRLSRWCSSSTPRPSRTRPMWAACS